jgi:hypothetical protein
MLILSKLQALPVKFKNGSVVAILILFGLTLIFFFKPVFYHQVLLPLDISQQFDTVFKVEGFKAHNYLLSDVVFEFLPNYSLVKQAFQQSTLPLWNPYILTGQPFLADSQTGVFELTKVFSYIFNLGTLDFFLFSAVIKILLAGFFCYLFLRNLSVSKLISLLGSMAFMFSGPMVVWLNYSLTSVYIWLPLLLYSADKIIAGGKNYFILLSFTCLFTLLAGYPQAVFISFGLLIAYSFFRFWEQKPSRWKGSWPLILISLLIGISLSVFQTGPSFDFIRQTESYEVGRGSRAIVSLSKTASDQFLNLKDNLNLFGKRLDDNLKLAFDPDYFGNPVKQNYKNPENNIYNNYSELSHYAGIAIFILGIFSLLYIKRNQIKFWLIIAVVSFALAANLPFINLLGYLPIINKISLNRFWLFFVWSLIILACLTLQQLKDHFASTKFKNKTNFVIVVLLFWLIIDLFAHFIDFNTSTDRKNFDQSKQNDVVKFLNQNLTYERIIGIDSSDQGFKSPLVPNSGMLYQLFDLRGYNPLISKDYIKIADEFLNRKGSFVLANKLPDQNFINLAGVKYVVCSVANCLSDDKNYKKVFESNNVGIYENLKVWPRAFLIHDDKDLLTDEIKISSEDQSNIVNYSLNQVRITGASAENGLLVLTDALAAGWQAKLNGQIVEIMPVAGIFRGVAVNKGQFELIFNYEPPHYMIYFIISIIGLLSLICLYIGLNWTKFKKLRPRT